MLRPLSSTLALALLAACASTGTSSGGDGPQTRRETTMVTSVNASGQTTVIPITTYTDIGGRSVDIGASADEVFRVLGEAYTDVGIEVKTIDAARRVAGNTQLQLRRRLGRANLSAYVNCGQTGIGGPTADTYPLRVSVLTTVEPSGDASRVRTVVQAAYVASEQSGTTPCTSTGELEALLARAVQLRLTRG